MSDRLAEQAAQVRTVMTAGDRLDDITRARMWSAIEDRVSAPAAPARAAMPRRARIAIGAVGALAVAATALLVVRAIRPHGDDSGALAVAADATLSTRLGPHARAALVGPAQLELVGPAGDATTARLVSGTLLAEFTGGPGRSLRIEAGDLVVEIVGTLFAVERDANRACVAVAHGTVRATVRGTVQLVTDQQQLCSDEPIILPLPEGMREQLVRHERGLQLASEPLPLPSPLPSPSPARTSVAVVDPVPASTSTSASANTNTNTSPITSTTTRTVPSASVAAPTKPAPASVAVVESKPTKPASVAVTEATPAKPASVTVTEPAPAKPAPVAVAAPVRTNPVPVPLPVPLPDPAKRIDEAPAPVATKATEPTKPTEPTEPTKPPKPAEPTPPTAEQLYHAAELALASGDRAAADRALARILALPGSSLADQALYERARIAYQDRRFADARRHLAALGALAATPLAEPGRYLDCRIAVQAKASDAERCFVAYRAAYPRSPHDLDVLAVLAQLAYARGGCDAAKPLRDELIARYPRTDHAAAWRSRCPEAP